RSTQQSPKSAGRAGPLPKHPEHDRPKKWSDKKTEQRLHVIHDAGKLHHQIGSAHADQYADYRRPAAHIDIVMIRALFINKRAIDVISPDGSESADIARHSGHESGDQRGDSQAKQARAEIARHHEGQYIVIAMGPTNRSDRLRDQFFGQHGETEQSRQNHNDWNE